MDCVNENNWNVSVFSAVHHPTAHTYRDRHTHTQQLCKVVESLTPKEYLSITTRVARETLLASMFVLLRLDKISWYIVVFGDNGMT